MHKITHWLLLLITGTILLLTSCGEALYTPGNLKNSGDLQPPAQEREGNFWQMETAEKTENPVKLYHFSQGEEAGTPVLILHGGPAVPPAKAWPGLEEISGYTFHYFHQRGSGKSTRPFMRFSSKNYPENVTALDERLGIKRLLEDIEKIRRILGTEKIILIGHSYGGFLAVLYALEFPERVDKMILIEPADMLQFPPARGGMDQIKEALSIDEQREYRRYMKEYFNYGQFFKKNEQELAILNAGYGKFYMQALEEAHPGAAERMGPAALIKNNGGFAGHAPFFSMGRRYDHRALLRNIKAPVLILHGQQDLYGPETGREYASYLPDVIYNELTESSHFPFYEEPEAFRELVEDFLNESID